jgi:hypothetical protein
MTIGNKEWAITDGWIPPLGDETVAFLNFSFLEAIPRATDYATTIESDVPIVVQHRGSPSCVPSYDSRDHQTSSNARSMNRRN